MELIEISSKDENNTICIAENMAPIFEVGDIILLKGEMSSGKTYFTKGIANNFIKKDVVTSPTFSIANFYHGEDMTLLHIDMYRIETIEEFEDLGITEYFDDAIVLIEWGDRLMEYLDEYFFISMERDDKRDSYRNISITAKGERLTTKMKKIQEMAVNFREC